MQNDIVLTDAPPTTTPGLEGRVDLVILPITLGLRAGTMRLADGRLTYTRRRRTRVVFDAPLQEFHSFGRSSIGTGFHLWHGARRYRFIVDQPAVPVGYGSSLIADAAEAVVQVHQGIARTARSRAEVDRWHDALVPVIASEPPPGVMVRRPWSTCRLIWATAGIVTGVAGALVAVITAIVAAS